MQYKLYRDAETGEIDTKEIGELYVTIEISNKNPRILYRLNVSNNPFHKVKGEMISSLQAKQYEITFHNELAIEKYGKTRTCFYEVVKNLSSVVQIINTMKGSFNL